MKKTISLLAMALLVAFAIPAEKPHIWDAILIDVSSDMMITDSRGASEISLVDKALEYLDSTSTLPDSVMVFANGRAVVSWKEYVLHHADDFKEMRLILGDGSDIYSSILSYSESHPEAKRILVLTNGIHIGSPFHPSTAAKIIREKEVTADAIIPHIEAIMPADSICGFTDRRLSAKGIHKFVKVNGGKALNLTAGDDIASLIKDYTSTLNKVKPSKKCPSGLDQDLLSRFLGDLKPVKYEILKVDTAQTLSYNGYQIHGLKELRRIARNSNHPFVGLDEDNYSEIESFDATNVSRSYQNFYFAMTSEELVYKREMMKMEKGNQAYCKLTDKTPLNLLPMVYYSGDGDTMEVCGLELLDEEIEEDEEEDGE